MFRLPTCLEGPALGAPPRVCGGAQAVDIEIQAKEVVFRFKVRATLRVRGGAQAVDIEIQAKEIMYHKANLNRIMAECTSQPIEQARPALLPPGLPPRPSARARPSSRRAPPSGALAEGSKGALWWKPEGLVGFDQLGAVLRARASGTPLRVWSDLWSMQGADSQVHERGTPCGRATGSLKLGG